MFDSEGHTGDNGIAVDNVPDDQGVLPETVAEAVPETPVNDTPIPVNEEEIDVGSVLDSLYYYEPVVWNEQTFLECLKDLQKEKYEK